MRTILYLLFSLSAFFVSCNKLQVEAPSLSVQPISLTIKAGDTAKFQFSGYADYINFYSGEVGRDYYKRDHYCPTKIGINFSKTLYSKGLHQKNTMFLFQG